MIFKINTHYFAKWVLPLDTLITDTTGNVRIYVALRRLRVTTVAVQQQ